MSRLRARPPRSPHFPTPTSTRRCAFVAERKKDVACPCEHLDPHRPLTQVPTIFLSRKRLSNRFEFLLSGGKQRKRERKKQSEALSSPRCACSSGARSSFPSRARAVEKGHCTLQEGPTSLSMAAIRAGDESSLWDELGGGGGGSGGGDGCAGRVGTGGPGAGLLGVGVRSAAQHGGGATHTHPGALELGQPSSAAMYENMSEFGDDDDDDVAHETHGLLDDDLDLDAEAGLLDGLGSGGGGVGSGRSAPGARVGRAESSGSGMFFGAGVGVGKAASSVFEGMAAVSSSSSSSILSGGGGGGSSTVDDLDDFFSRMYKFYDKRGLACMLADEGTTLLRFGFCVAFTAFIVAMMDWRALLLCGDTVRPFLNVSGDGGGGGGGGGDDASPTSASAELCKPFPSYVTPLPAALAAAPLIVQVRVFGVLFVSVLQVSVLQVSVLQASFFFLISFLPLFPSPSHRLPHPPPAPRSASLLPRSSGFAASSPSSPPSPPRCAWPPCSRGRSASPSASCKRWIGATSWTASPRATATAGGPCLVSI